MHKYNKQVLREFIRNKRRKNRKNHTQTNNHDILFVNIDLNLSRFFCLLFIASFLFLFVVVVVIYLFKIFSQCIYIISINLGYGKYKQDSLYAFFSLSLSKENETIYTSKKQRIRKTSSNSSSVCYLSIYSFKII